MEAGIEHLWTQSGSTRLCSVYFSQILLTVSIQNDGVCQCEDALA